MQINIKLSIEVDTDKWADDYGFDKVELDRTGTYVLQVKEHALHALTSDAQQGLDSHKRAGRITDVTTTAN